MRVRIAARGSKLSLKQVETFQEYLTKHYDGIEFEVIKVKTTGDKFQLPFEELAKKGHVGLFEKEVNKAVIDGKADVAVHSLKDLSTKLSDELVIALYLPRDPPYDVLISRNGERLEELPSGAVVGTSSARRKALIKNLRPDLEVRDLRGNVDTRLRKLREGEYDAIILAEAGLRRLGIDVEYQRLDWKTFTPSPAQGIVVAVTRKDSELYEMLRKVSDNRSELMARTERNVLLSFGGGCHIPLGAISFVNDNGIMLKAVAFDLKIKTRLDVELIGSGPEIGLRAGEFLKRGIIELSGS
ncbi:porphobilinogen deaminase [Ignicoccus islandicus DSM 13165]|uniref:Probable porphobilinogen deaminase n=1 Tax=Ignicoccus islandicus DSM 13165 TaxID=940295 RepID=A0A0U3F8R6_9CREN|nr:hydroxymethylbilane synthase [Ignicoccus islandicus]ALU12025.1 porphobilinogen deaminase [Ignicoccus islandicus DSM 13165]